jgi:tryptophanyl-tRNA synthetase
MDDPAEVERELLKGAEKARTVSVPFIAGVRHAVGIRKLG